MDRSLKGRGFRNCELFMYYHGDIFFFSYCCMLFVPRVLFSGGTPRNLAFGTRGLWCGRGLSSVPDALTLYVSFHPVDGANSEDVILLFDRDLSFRSAWI